MRLVWFILPSDGEDGRSTRIHSQSDMGLRLDRLNVSYGCLCALDQCLVVTSGVAVSS